MGLLGGLFGGGSGAGLERRREKLLRTASEGPARDYLGAPFAATATPVADLRLLAIDVETTGLDAGKDLVLSVGFVPIDGGRVVLSGARHLVLRQPTAVGQSATIHGLTDDDIAGGVEPKEALAETLAALTGRVLLAHYARIETDFIAAATKRVWGVGVPFVAVDTMDLQRRLTTRWGSEPLVGTLRLWPARGHFGLPAYKAHEALTDAVACAELYLAQVAELEARADGRVVTLGDLLG